MCNKKNKDSNGPKREIDEEFGTRKNVEANSPEMKPYTRRSDLPFIRMAERYGGAVMKNDD